MVPATLSKVFCAIMSAATKPPLVIPFGSTANTVGANFKWISNAASLATLSTLIQTLTVLFTRIEDVGESMRTGTAPGARVGVLVGGGVLVGVIIMGAGVEVLSGVFVMGVGVEALAGVFVTGGGVPTLIVPGDQEAWMAVPF